MFIFFLTAVCLGRLCAADLHSLVLGQSSLSEIASQQWHVQVDNKEFDVEMRQVAHFADEVRGVSEELSLLFVLKTLSWNEATLSFFHERDKDDQNEEELDLVPFVSSNIVFSFVNGQWTGTGQIHAVEDDARGQMTCTFISLTNLICDIRLRSSVTIVFTGNYSPPPTSFLSSWGPTVFLIGSIFLSQFLQSTLTSKSEKKRIEQIRARQAKKQ